MRGAVLVLVLTAGCATGHQATLGLGELLFDVGAAIQAARR